MRYQSIRSSIRAAIAAALIGSCQQATLFANWKELLQPYAGACFVHDHSWENYGASLANRNGIQELVNQGSSGSTDDWRQESQAKARETEICIAVARNFELRRQLNAAWSFVESKSNAAKRSSSQVALIGAQIPHAIQSWIQAESPRLYQATLASVETSNSNVLEPIDSAVTVEDILCVIPQAANMTACLGAELECQEVQWMADEPESFVNELVSIADESKPIDADWNCTDWNRDCQSPANNMFPNRDHANIFVFAFQREPLQETPIYDTLTELDAPETVSQLSAFPNVESEARSEAQPRNQWQVGIDPVCMEIHTAPTANRWNEWMEQPSVCCPIDNVVYDTRVTTDSIATHDVIATNAIPHRPPTLESDVIAAEQASTTLASPLPDAEDAMVATEPILAPVPFSDFDWNIKSRFLPWKSWVGERVSQYGWMQRNHALVNENDSQISGDSQALEFRAPSTSVQAFTEDDLSYASKIAAQSMQYPDEEFAIESIYGHDAVATAESANSSPVFHPDDFMTYRWESSTESILVPLKATQRAALDFAMNHLWNPATNSGLHASKNLAKQIRSVGLFLVDFAHSIENRADQVEIARQDSHQR
jgi:hypothetical protein